jgi:hypothetical protein
MLFQGPDYRVQDAGWKVWYALPSDEPYILILNASLTRCDLSSRTDPVETAVPSMIRDAVVFPKARRVGAARRPKDRDAGG